MKKIVPLVFLGIIAVVVLVGLPLIFGGFEDDFVGDLDANETADYDDATSVVQMAQPAMIVGLIGLGIVVLVIGLKRLSRIRV